MTSAGYIRTFWLKYGGYVAVVAAFVSTIYIATGLYAVNQGDIAWYQWIVHDWAIGRLPYLMHPVEYPPYALLIFLIPWWLGDVSYFFHFMVLALALDVAIKVMLYYAGHRQTVDKNDGAKRVGRAYLPLVAYSAAVPFISYFYLQRFDLWPAAVALAALVLFWRKKYLISGILLSVAVGIKLYPAVFVLPLLVLAWRRKKWRAFLVGLVFGIVPIIIISFFLPWWRFAEFQGARGLQVESLYASIIWFWHFLSDVPLTWIRTTAWYEIQGPLPSAVLEWARILFAGSVLASTIVSMRAAWRRGTADLSAGYVARLVLLPLLAFTVFNLVFSPQYMIWLLPVAVLAMLEGNSVPTLLVLVSAVFISSFYPVADYFSHGLTMGQTAALLARNLLLLAAWIWLMIEQLYAKRHD